MSEDKMPTGEYTPSQLARMAKHWLPQPGQPQYTMSASCRLASQAVDELERRAAADKTIKVVDVQTVSEWAAAYLPLPPAESCAHAVERFRDALEDLTERHGVEVGVRFICATSAPGITDLPHPSESFDDAVRERKAWDAIEAWIDRAPVVARRGTEFRKTLRPRCGQPDMHILIVNEHSSDKFERGGVRSSQHQSKPFHALKRIVALEAAAAWCEGQK